MGEKIDLAVGHLEEAYRSASEANRCLGDSLPEVSGVVLRLLLLLRELIEGMAVDERVLHSCEEGK